MCITFYVNGLSFQLKGRVTLNLKKNIWLDYVMRILSNQKTKAKKTIKQKNKKQTQTHNLESKRMGKHRPCKY